MKEEQLNEYDWHVGIGQRCGRLTSYLTHFIEQMTPDQRELIAIEFDRNLFSTDKAMANRFRDANNNDLINN